MKTILFTFLSIVVLNNFSNAETGNHLDSFTTYGSFLNQNAVVFEENKIEFAIFADGQFDFALPSYNSGWSVTLTNSGFSFNTGFNYNPYIQYDNFGAVIQIENTPIYYDNFGRVSQIGYVGIRYNRFGHLIGVGGLNVAFHNSTIVKQGSK